MNVNTDIFKGWGIFVVLLAVMGLPALAGTYSGGSGTETDPYLISTAEDMQSIGVNPADWGKHFLLTADIDLSGYTGTEFNIIGYYISSFNNDPFTGVFDGNAHTLSNFTYTSTDSDCIGLFGFAGSGALIKDLTLVTPGVNAAGESYYVACLVGLLKFGTITGCGISGGNISGRYYTGGLVGYNYWGTISNCYAETSVWGHSDTGGLAGYNDAGTISNCHAEVSVFGVPVGPWGESESTFIGRLVGCNWAGTISSCNATGSVTGDDSVGGLVGSNWGRISNSYGTGSVTGGLWTGGLVGYNRGTISDCYASGYVIGIDFTAGLAGKNEGMISNCYAQGTVYGNWITGGLAGSNGGTISNCYGTGSVSGTTHTGGLVGYNFYGTVSNSYGTGSVSGTTHTGGLVGSGGWAVNCFWDIDTSGQTSSAGGEGKTTEQMQTISTFTDAGWDFIDETANGSEDIWRLCQDGTDYPKLAWQFITLGDFVCPDGVEINDLDVFTQQWLLEKLSADVASGGGDGIVDFLDWAVFANAWQNTADLAQVLEFARQWLRFGAYCADIAPPGGDEKVDMLDFAVLAQNWLKGPGQ